MIDNRPYYSREELEQMSIKEFSDTLKTISTITYSDELIDAGDSEFVLDNADVFRQGICQLFAYALNEKYQYPVYIIRVGASCHIFCKSHDRKSYIDVRGITQDFERFIRGTDIPYISNDTSEPYLFVEEDFSGDYYDIGLEFARAIVNDDMSRYRM